MENKKTILVISYSNLHADPRVLRQIDFLGKHFNIITAGLHESQHPYEKSFTFLSSYINVTFHFSYPWVFRKLISLFYVLPRYFFLKVRDYLSLKVFKSYDKYYWNYEKRTSLSKLEKLDFDLVIANDLEALPLAIGLKQKKNCKVYFDAHEYSPLEYENDPQWLKYRSPYFIFLCKKYIPDADYCTTVAHKIAEKYLELTDKPFDVVYNSPKYQDLTAVPVAENMIRCVHHGVSSPIRKIESMINAFIALGPHFELNLLLMVNDKKYHQNMIALAKGYDNIIFHEPVATKDISKFINRFDVSLIFIPPVNFNYEFCLPNKFFESVQARLMLLCGPSAEMEYLVDKYQLGLISNGFDSEHIRKSLEHITSADIMKYKSHSDQSARFLAAETIMEKLHIKLKQVCAE